MILCIRRPTGAAGRGLAKWGYNGAFRACRGATRLTAGAPETRHLACNICNRKPRTDFKTMEMVSYICLI